MITMRNIWIMMLGEYMDNDVGDMPVWLRGW